ncbi:MAG: plastocyanin/azurin family copper-binding protein [Gaiellaceae bacterium]
MALLVAATGAFAAPSRTVTLKGSVGPGYTITLQENGQKVKTLRAGTYRFVVSDRASVHNFVLEKEHGGRFEKELTDVSAVGTKTVLVKLTPGTWKYYCEPHEATMVGSFTVR